MKKRAAVREGVDLEAAVHLHYKSVFRFALHLARHPDDAADLTQHAYETLMRKHQQISDPGKVKGWLHSTVYRKFIDQKRRIIRFPQVELNEEVNTAAQSVDFGERIDAKAAVAALMEMEEDLRIPLSLFYLEACSYKEIAAILDIPLGTVMSRLYRGKEKLYQQLSPQTS